MVTISIFGDLELYFTQQRWAFICETKPNYSEVIPSHCHCVYHKRWLLCFWGTYCKLLTPRGMLLVCGKYVAFYFNNYTESVSDVTFTVSVIKLQVCFKAKEP